MTMNKNKINVCSFFNLNIDFFLILIQNIIKHMAKKTAYDIEREERMVRPARLEGRVQNAQRNKKKGKKK